MEITTHTPGSFCTVVLRTGDLERSAAFHGALVGWTDQKLRAQPATGLLKFDARDGAGAIPGV